MSDRSREYLLAIAELFSDPARHTTGTPARDAKGRACQVNDPDAVCWCFVGGSVHVENVMGISDSEYRIAMGVFNDVFAERLVTGSHQSSVHLNEMGALISGADGEHLTGREAIVFLCRAAADRFPPVGGKAPVASACGASEDGSGPPAADPVEKEVNRCDLSIRRSHHYVGTYRHLDDHESIGSYRHLVSKELSVEVDNDDGSDPKRVEHHVIVEAPDRSEADIKRALQSEFNQHGCAHEYDCCGCRSYSAGTVEQVTGDLWRVVVSSSRNV